jgi:hypothetical protein
MYYQSRPVFIYEINYPIFSTTCASGTAHKVNRYYLAKAGELESRCRNELFSQAVSGLGNRPLYPSPFPSYTFSSDYKITYNFMCTTSLYSDQYSYMGGAHGATIRNSETWNFKDGKQMTLQHFFPDQEDFKEKIIENIEQQISEKEEKNPETYFDNYRELLRENFHPENFYLTPEGIVIYYQQYELAPYVAGIQEFKL